MSAQPLQRIEEVAGCCRPSFGAICQPRVKHEGRGMKGLLDVMSMRAQVTF